MRDRDLLEQFAARHLVFVHVSLTTLDDGLKRVLEPRAAAPRPVRTIRELTSAGVPVGVLLAPMIPALNDHELERLLDAAAANGATRASFIPLRCRSKWLGCSSSGCASTIPRVPTGCST